MFAITTVKIPAKDLERLGIQSFHQDIIVSFTTSKRCTDEENHEIINIFLASVSARQNLSHRSQQKPIPGSRYSYMIRQVSDKEAKTYKLFLETAKQYGVQPASRTIPCN